MKYVLGFDIGGTKSAVLLARPGKENVEFLERKAIPTHGSAGLPGGYGKSLFGNTSDIRGRMLYRRFLRRTFGQRQRCDFVAA